MSVSVVMPNYNNARYLPEWAEPLLDDPAVNEIVVYDNASTDESRALLEQMGSNKIRIIRGDGNVGATIGRHQAIVHARNELICFVDGDDKLSPGAVSRAAAAISSDDLDIALFDLVNVDENGRNPVPFIIPPREVFDGRTACALTLGRWRMHIWGVMKKSVYLQAWAEFSPHGYSDDELLTRGILIKAHRIRGCDATIFYRVIAKNRGSEQLIGIARTAVRVLALAVRNGLEQACVMKQRKVALRYLAGMVRRALVGKVSRREVAALLNEYFGVPRSGSSPMMAVAEVSLRTVRPFLR